MMDTWKAAQGDGVIVAVIDTGVAKVPDLNETEIVPGWNFVTDSANAADDHGHGTHVAGTIAQSTHNGIGVAGVAFHAKIMPIKVLSARGSGSVGGHRRRHPLGGRSRRQGHQHVARRADGLVGARRRRSSTPTTRASSSSAPPATTAAARSATRPPIRDAIAVAATQFDETTTFYSNWGKEIDIAAPGGNTRVDQNGDGQPDGVLQNTIVPGDISQNDYLWFMGTSMASPHVAGVAALVVGQGVTNPDAVEKVLKETARKPKAGKKDNQNRYGAGIVDAAAAVKKAQLGYGGLELGAALGFFGADAAAPASPRARGARPRRRRLRARWSWARAACSSCRSSFHVPAASILAHGFPAWEPAIARQPRRVGVPLGAGADRRDAAALRHRRAAVASRPASRSASARTWRSSPSPAPSPSRRCGWRSNAMAALGAGYLSLRK